MLDGMQNYISPSDSFLGAAVTTLAEVD